MVSLWIKIDIFLILVSSIGMLFLWLIELLRRHKIHFFHKHFIRCVDFFGRKIHFALKDVDTNISVCNISPSMTYLSKEKKNDLLKRAHVLVDRGYISNAKKLLIEAKSLAADDIDITLLLADLYCKQKSYKKSFILLEDVQSNDKELSLEQKDKLQNILIELDDYRKHS
jgi:hypothetical protein